MEAEQTIDVAAAWHELGDRLRVYVVATRESRRCRRCGAVGDGEAAGAPRRDRRRLRSRVALHGHAKHRHRVLPPAPPVDRSRQLRRSSPRSTTPIRQTGPSAISATASIRCSACCRTPMPTCSAASICKERRRPSWPHRSAFRFPRSSRVCSERVRNCARPSMPAARSTWARNGAPIAFERRAACPPACVRGREALIDVAADAAAVTPCSRRSGTSGGADRSHPAPRGKRAASAPPLP